MVQDQKEVLLQENLKVSTNWMQPVSQPLVYTAPDQIHQDCMSQTQNGWNQHPPAFMPWSSLCQPRVTRFYGDPSVSQISESPYHQQLWQISNTHWADTFHPGHCKRKIEADIDEPSRKQLITEEKMSAHLSRLRISPVPEKPPQPVSSQPKESLLDKIQITNNTKLVLSKELQLVYQQSPIPSAVLEPLNKPTMALVLWQPPTNIIKDGFPKKENGAVNPQSNSNVSSQVPVDQVARSSREEPEDTNNNGSVTDMNLELYSGQQDVEMDENL